MAVADLGNVQVQLCLGKLTSNFVDGERGAPRVEKIFPQDRASLAATWFTIPHAAPVLAGRTRSMT